jgi:nitrate reductase assembly molybdenum cofactor insertion protein NarJ
MHALTVEATQLLNEATEWRLLSLLFEYPSDVWRSQVAALMPDLVDEELHGWARSALQYAAPGLYLALFGPAGSVPIREVAYQGGVQLGYLMAELSGYYHAFGYQPASEETVDHLATEVGFVSFLKLKQAYASFHAAHDQARFARDAAGAFCREHIAVMAEPAVRALETFAPDYLIQAGRRLQERVGPAPGSGYPLGAAIAGEDTEEMSCGSSPAGEELIQLQP